MTWSAAIGDGPYSELRAHLLRADGQEDVAFALWHPSTGRDRTTAVISRLILPLPGDRAVHGNASFSPAYFARALREAVSSGAGMALVHSHPRGEGWQGVSEDDAGAEREHAPAAFGATGRPLLGMTMAGDGALSARVWIREAVRMHRMRDCDSVRVVGERLTVFSPRRGSLPVPGSLVRTVSAWGPDAQSRLAGLRVGIVGLGSVGSVVAEALARTGVERIRLIDFDSAQEVNHDRTLGATRADVALARSKVEAARRRVQRAAHSAILRVEEFESSVVEEDGFRAALDCDVLFSCVDRPWARAALNLIAYAHLVPVIDGGIVVRTAAGARMLGAEWRAHTAAPSRRCLECLGQYDPGLVSAEREGYLDRPDYIEGLPDDHPARRHENVFAFGLADASLEVLQFLSLVVAPGGVADFGAQRYVVALGRIELDSRPCEPECLYAGLFAGQGDDTGINVTGRHPAADTERTARRARRGPRVRALRAAATLAGAVERRLGLW